jgi:diguanylate cyclase (GGDEF)-like protein/PAS domain S-box-containing protein
VDTSEDLTAESRVSTDPDGKLLLVKSVLRVLPGCACKETTGQYSAAVKPGWRPLAFLEELWDVIRFGKSWQSGLIAMRNPGRPCKEELRIVPVPDSNDDIASHSACNWDATGRIWAMRALAESEARFLKFFEENGAVMFLADPAVGTIVAANKAASSYYGYAREALAGMPMSQINILEQVDVVFEQEQAVREERNFFNSLHRLSCGQQRSVEVYSAPVEVEGRPLLLSIVHDVTARKRTERELRDSEERYRSTFEQAAIGIAHTSFEGIFLRCNARFAEIIGYPIEEVSGLTFQQITAPEDLASSTGALRQMLNGTASTSILTKRYFRKDGSLTWVRITVSMQCDAEGRALHSIALVEDINAQRDAEEGLVRADKAREASEERYRTAFQTSLDAIAINRVIDGLYLEVNHSFVDTMGYARKELIGQTSLQLGIWADLRDRQNLIEIAQKHSTCRDLEVQLRRKNGEVFWGMMSVSLITLEGVPCLLSVLKDLSVAKIAEQEIEKLAFYDTLTGLPNRRMLFDRLRPTLLTSARKASKRALLFIDLDDFKTLNDTLGHHTGDLLLQELSLRLKTCLREADTVARTGGDEFAVLLENLGDTSDDAKVKAKGVADKILAIVGRPYQIAGHACQLTSSIGIAMFGSNLESANSAFQQADIALYKAKASGRNSIHFFSPALQTAVNARATMEEGLRQAIVEKQFLLYYQPQIDRGHLIGAEALLRWEHPKLGIVAPGEFISLAEETGLILPLGNWVLETACMQIAKWANREETSPITVAVNISAQQFRQADFVEQVLAALNTTGANPRNLKLELTESVLVQNVEDVILKMTRLRRHGVKFSVDDFGTGYSSLTYLNRLPLDQLKIDRSFVREILLNSTSGAIAQTIISLSAAMGLSVIAEGVETEEQREFLARMGCHAFQGYLFSRPLPLQEFQQRLPSFVDKAGAIPQ